MRTIFEIEAHFSTIISGKKTFVVKTTPWLLLFPPSHLILDLIEDRLIQVCACLHRIYCSFVENFSTLYPTRREVPAAEI